MNRSRSSNEQFMYLLEYMKANGDISRPVGGAQGRMRADRLWEALTHGLNAIGNGSTKTTEKWKKVWADLKSKTKKKGLRIRQAANGTGGGPHDGQSLSALELRVLAIMGPLAVQGHGVIEELGFTSTDPAQRPDSQAESGNIEQIYVNEYSPVAPSPPLPPPLPQNMQQHTTEVRNIIIEPTNPGPSTPAGRPADVDGPVLVPPAPAAHTSRRLSATPLSPSRRPNLRSRQRRGPTPFERAANDFMSVQRLCVEVEEKRAAQIMEFEERRAHQMLELQRMHIKLHHERELRQLDVQQRQTEAFSTGVLVAQQFVGVVKDYREYLKTRSNTEPINFE